MCKKHCNPSLICKRLLWAVTWSVLAANQAWSAHAYAQFGDILYPADFQHFQHVNPNAPKGGELRLVSSNRASSFDKYNPFTLKGIAPPGLLNLVFESLLTGNREEPATAYGLLADDVSLAPDRLSVSFRLHPLARFHDGEPVLAHDVKDSFDRLTSRHAAPQYRALYGEVERVVVLDPRSVRFDFKRVNPELPLIVGSMPVFSRRWGAGKAFDQMVTDIPVASGPYRIDKAHFGRDINYQRDPNYWAQNLPVRRGMYNFDRITYRIYKDNLAHLESFRVRDFDFIQSFIAREWARSFEAKSLQHGLVIKREFKHGNAGDFQGFLFNTRLPKLADPRVREALALTLDFEWMNRQLFYNAYARVRGYFVGSMFEAKGLPGADELALLEPLRDKLPAAVFDLQVPTPPVTSLDPKSGHSLRDNLRRARTLLEQAGWAYRDGALRNAQGQAFTLEFLDSSGSMSRVITPMIKNMNKLGIQVQIRVVDFAVFQKRLDVFDFEVISNRYVGSEAPGTELLDRFGSAAASIEGSGNLIGVSDPAVDSLLQHVISATTRTELSSALRSLDRVLRHQHYTIPHWYSSVHRVAWWAYDFKFPGQLPIYYQPEDWATAVWWFNRPSTPEH